ncbi:MAG TPA: diacylglycerol kinase family protein [Polyangia bacterium]|nr:diacylglycerol kinase family protein [Polyangia bacterium]
MSRRRLAAAATLGLGSAALAALAVLVVADPWRGLWAVALFAAAVAVAWQGLRRRGVRRLVGLGAGALLLVGFVTLVMAREPLVLLASVVALALALSAGAYAFRLRATLPRAPRPRRPALFYNPRSGGGKAARFRLPDEARARGIAAIELVPGADLAQLVRQALDGGADAVAMAGGDGSQALVAGIAAERGVPFACIPAGTRNHFALDLGVDRDDVVGALDALVAGGERRVDLGEVNGRVFVNNVSLGLYGEAVQRKEYRDAKVRTLLEKAPDVLGPQAKPNLRWRGPDGTPCDRCRGVLVSNDPYRLGLAIGAGTRPRLDAGVLGVAVIGAAGDGAGVQSWTTPSFEVEAQGKVAAGVDGEALLLDPPLRFRTRPAALRCRIAPHHPGASPSAFAPERAWAVVSALVGIAAGHDPRPVPGR